MAAVAGGKPQAFRPSRSAAGRATAATRSRSRWRARSGSRSAIGSARKAQDRRPLPLRQQGRQPPRLAGRRQRAALQLQHSRPHGSVDDAGGRQRAAPPDRHLGRSRSRPGTPTAARSRTACAGAERPQHRGRGRRTGRKLSIVPATRANEPRTTAIRAGRQTATRIAVDDDVAGGSLGRDRPGRQPDAARRRRRLARVVARRRHDRLRRPRRRHGLGCRPERRQPPPAAARLGAQGPVGRLVARRRQARVQHRHGHLRCRAGREERRASGRQGRQPGRPSFSPDGGPARVRRRCRHRPPLPRGLGRRRRRQRAAAAHDRPVRQLRPGLAPGGLSRRRGRGGTACRAARAACRPRGSGGRSRRPRRSRSCRRPRRRSPRS